MTGCMLTPAESVCCEQVTAAGSVRSVWRGPVILMYDKCELHARTLLHTLNFVRTVLTQAGSSC